jgi:hypothetical protein
MIGNYTSAEPMGLAVNGPMQLTWYAPCAATNNPATPLEEPTMDLVKRQDLSHFSLFGIGGVLLRVLICPLPGDTLISAMHTTLFFSMLLRAPQILWHRRRT